MKFLRNPKKSLPLGGHGMYRDFLVLLLVVGVLLTTATQLRPETVPVGPGELVLLAWIGWQLSVVLLNPMRVSTNPGIEMFRVFWAVFFTLLMVALAVAYLRGLWHESGAARDAVALAFSAIYALLLTGFLDNGDRMRWFVMTLVRMCGAAMFLLLILAATRSSLFGIDPWYAVIRFTGWASNPNQVGLLLVSMPFLGAWLVLQYDGFKRLSLIVAVVVLTVAGILTASDALFVGWLGGGLAVLILFWLDSLFRSSSRGFPNYAVVLFLPGLVIITALIFAVTLLDQFVTSLINIYELSGQGSVRLQIWAYGVEAFLESPLIGHGPGAFAGITGPFQGEEAHNTFIDIATQAGIVGLLCYLGMLGVVFVRLFRTGQYMLLGALTSITLFSAFHFVLRQPIYWTVLVVCIHAAWNVGRSNRHPLKDLVRLRESK